MCAVTCGLVRLVVDWSDWSRWSKGEDSGSDEVPASSQLTSAAGDER